MLIIKVGLGFLLYARSEETYWKNKLEKEKDGSLNCPKKTNLPPVTVGRDTS